MDHRHRFKSYNYKILRRKHKSKYLLFWFRQHLIKDTRNTGDTKIEIS